MRFPNTVRALAVLVAVGLIAAPSAAKDKKPAPAAPTTASPAPRPTPADQSSWSAYGKLNDENRAVLRQILEEAAPPRPDRDPAARLVGDYYAACMDEKAAEERGSKPLAADLQRIDGLRTLADLAR